MLYLFHGPDDFTRSEKITELQAELGDPSLADLNVAWLEGRDLRLADIRHYADAMPFMTTRRVVVVRGFCSGQKDKEEIKRLADYLAQIPPTTDLILVEEERLDRRHTVLKAAAAAGGTVVYFGPPDQRNLPNWIMKRGKKEYGVTIEPAAADLLGRLVGTELRTLNNEIEKLSLYVANARPVQRADVELLVPYVEDAENFGLANAIGQRNAVRAYDQLHKLLDENKHPMAILASIATQIRGLLEVKDMAERGMSPQEIAAKKNWRSDYAAKMRLREAANFSMSRLEEILELLLEIDLKIKTGQIDNLLALDTLIARLCTTQR